MGNSRFPTGPAPRNYYPEAADAPVPPVAYATPQTHMIYYSSAAYSGATAIALAKYTSVSVTINLYGDAAEEGARCGAAMTAVRNENPNIELYWYVKHTEVDSAAGGNGANYGGAYSNIWTEVTDNDWFLRTIATPTQLVRTYTDNQTTHPLGPVTQRGAWVSGTSYTAGVDTVVFGGQQYLCQTSNSDVSWTVGKWTTFLGTFGASIIPGVKPNNGAGLSPTKWIVRWGYYMATRGFNGWTGCYQDSFGYGPNNPSAATGNWLGDGVDRRPYLSRPVRDGLLAACAEFSNELRSLNPSYKIFANTPVNGDGTDGFWTGATRYYVSEGTGGTHVDSALYESAVGRVLGFTALNNGGVINTGDAYVMNTLPIKAQNVRSAGFKGTVLGCRLKSLTEYNIMRLGTALALMQDCRISVNVWNDGYAPSTFPWFDEWDAEIGAGIDAVQSAYVSSTIMKRRFQNGVVLLNGAHLLTTDNGAWSPATGYTKGQTVTYNGLRYVCEAAVGPTATTPNVDTAFWYAMSSSARPVYMPGTAATVDSSIIPYGVYKRINGTQDAAWNNGTTVTSSFSLPAWDAIILLCVKPGVHS
jgi:hypothetical protein